MSPKIFTLKEREAARVMMLDAGFNLIKKYGLTHTSVDKITKAVGLGKSTFYNFFQSKEMFVYEIINYQRDRTKQIFMNILGDRDKMTISQAKAFLKDIIFSEDSIYQYLTPEDVNKLKLALSPEYQVSSEGEMTIMENLFHHMEGVKKDLDYKVIANLIKIMALIMCNQDSLHSDALKRTLDSLYILLFSHIFEEKSSQ